MFVGACSRDMYHLIVLTLAIVQGITNDYIHEDVAKLLRMYCNR